MALRKASPVTWAPVGLSDAVSADLGFQGCMASLTNLVPDPGAEQLWQCRPAARVLSTFTGFSSPGAISALLVIGSRAYGMIATSRNAGKDEPFVYDLLSGTFVTVTGVTSGNVPSSPASTGGWVPPVMVLVGGKILVAHQGFDVGAGNFFGVLDINNPTAPAWSAGTLTGAVTLPSKPISIALYSGRAWYAVGNALVFSDTTSPTNCTAGTQVLTLGTNQTIVAMEGMPLISQVQGGVIQALSVFTGASVIYQITGDVALNDLLLNQLNIETGTYSQNSLCPTPKGLCFVSPEGIRFLPPSGLVSEPVGTDGKGLAHVFNYASTPTRIAMAYSGDTIRISVPSNYGGVASTQEFFYHLSTGVWGGPHTFPGALVASYGSSFIIAPVGVPAAIYQSNVLPTSVDSYVENGIPMVWRSATPLLPGTGDMAMHELLEQTLGFAPSGLDSYTFSVVDEAGSVLASTTLGGGSGGSLWGSAIWGASRWGGNLNAVYSTVRLDYGSLVVFKQAAFIGGGRSSGALRIGPMHARVRKLGYASVYATV